MPPSVLLREKTPQTISSSINFSTSKLEDSFLYLSVPSQSRRRESPHQTLLPSTISQNNHSPARNRTHSSPSSSKQVERQPVSGPYGGKKKSADVQRSPAYWGTTAGGFLSWATTGINSNQQTSNQKPETQAGSLSSKHHNPSLSVNWNDRSMILPQEGENMSMDQSYSATSTGALQLLATLKKLSENYNDLLHSSLSFPFCLSSDEEKERLEKLVEKLQIEKQKDEMLKQQVEEFKKEYQEKILIMRKKLAKKAGSHGSGNDSSFLDTGSTSSNREEVAGDPRVNPEKFYQLEKAVHGLMEKVKQVQGDSFFLYS